MNLSAGIDTGFYIVNLFNTENFVFNFHDVIKRDTAVFKPSALRYKGMDYNEIAYYYNELGNIISFQKLPDDTTKEEAYQLFQDNIFFNNFYTQLLSDSKKLFGYKLTDTDSSFLADVNEDISDFISWEFVKIKNNQEFLVFIEAAFIFQLCTRIDRNLNKLSSNNNNGIIKEIISRNIEDLFTLESSAGYLVAKNEIALMNEFYEKWEIKNLITKLKERFDLSLANLNFHKEHNEKRQNNLMNLLLAGIAIFTATQSAPLLKKIFPGINQLSIEIILVFIATIIIVYSLYRYFLLEKLFKVRYYIQRKRINRKINSN